MNKKRPMNVCILVIAGALSLGSVGISSAQSTEEATAENLIDVSSLNPTAEERGGAQATREAVQADAAAARAEAQAAREAAMAEREAARAEAMAEREAMIEEQRALMTERAKERITNLTANVSNRFDMAVVRLRNIDGRIESRINRLNESGQDTTEASNLLASAQSSLNQAETTLSTIDAVVANVVNSENPREVWPEVKVTFETVRDTLRTARSEMIAAVNSLKETPATPSTTETATPTVAPEPENTQDTSESNSITQ